MITKENESADASPDDLAKLRAEALRRQSTKSTGEKNWQYAEDPDNFQYGDSGLKLSRTLALSALAIIGITLLVPGSATVLFAGWGILLLYALHTIMQDRKKKAALDNSLRGSFSPLPVATWLWGVVIPLVTMVAAYNCLTVSNGLPQTDLTRWVFLSVMSLICCTVVAYSLSSEITKPNLLGLLNGFTIGGALALFALFGTVSFLVTNPNEFSIMLALSGLTLFYCAGLAKTLLLKVDRKKAFSVFSLACFGSLAAFILGVGPELRSFAVAIGEKLAVSQDQKQIDLGYNILKAVNAAPELDVASDSYNPHPPSSLIAALAPVEAIDAQRMFFFITGRTHKKPEYNVKFYQEATAPTPNKVAGLSLAESKMSGHVDANALTSVTYWTMVFGNQSEQAQEAQAKIALPPASTVSRVTLWINGVPQEAAFNSTERVKAAYEWITKRNRDPLLITETAPGIINLQAFPVPKFGEMKVRIGITSALEARSKRDFSFMAPHIISSNFSLDDSATEIKLESNAPITSNAGQANSSVKNSRFVYTAQLEPNSAKHYQFTAHRKSDFSGFSARATHSKEDMVISETLVNSPDQLRKLSVVIDGSEAIKKNREELKRALAAIPTSIQTKVLIADHREGVESLSLTEAIERLNNVEYGGGCDDTSALLAAKKHIGRDPHGAIVWIHGPQPLVFDQDKSPLLALMKRGDHRLKIYDYQVEEEQSNEVRNYLASLDQTASPEFRSIAQEDSVQKDLTSFFTSTLSAGADFAVVRAKVPNKHSSNTSYDFPVASRLSTIWAADEARKCAALGDSETAVLLGTVYRVVTPVTGAVVMELQTDYQYQDLHRNFYSVVSAKAHAAAGIDDGTSTVAPKAASQPITGDAFALVPSPSAAPAPAPVTRRSSKDSFSRGSGGALVPPPPAVTLSTIGDKSVLYGATNGTVGPQGFDATYVRGVNTAGTVRVNNLANLEGLLNIVANGIEVLGILYGGFCLLSAFFLKNTREQMINKLILGSTVLMIGISAPGVINWLIASARDSGGFS